MTHTALTFSLSDKQGRLLGMAIICLPARYATVLWKGADRLERAFIASAAWTEIEYEVKVGLPPRPLSPTSQIVKLLAPTGTTSIQWLSGPPIDSEPAGTLAERLDALLRQMAGGIGPLVR